MRGRGSHRPPQARELGPAVPCGEGPREGIPPATREGRDIRLRCDSSRGFSLKEALFWDSTVA